MTTQRLQHLYRNANKPERIPVQFCGAALYTAHKCLSPRLPTSRCAETRLANLGMEGFGGRREVWAALGPKHAELGSTFTRKNIVEFWVTACCARLAFLLVLHQDSSKCCIALLRSICASALLLRVADLDAPGSLCTTEYKKNQHPNARTLEKQQYPPVSVGMPHTSPVFHL